MTFMTKTRTATAASLVALLAAAPALAQDAEAELGAGATASTLGVDTGLEGEVNAEAETGNMTDTGEAAVAEAEGTEAETPEASLILASDAAVIGTVDQAETLPDGRVAYAVTLDPALGLDIGQIAFATDADVNAEGEVTLAMTGEEFAAAVMAQAEAMNDADVMSN